MTAFAACPEAGRPSGVHVQHGREPADDDTCLSWRQNPRADRLLPRKPIMISPSPIPASTPLCRCSRKGKLTITPASTPTKDDGRPLRARSGWRSSKSSMLHGARRKQLQVFQCGYKFTLTGHYRDSANVDYTLLMVEHHAAQYQLSVPASRTLRVPQPLRSDSQYRAVPPAAPGPQAGNTGNPDRHGGGQIRRRDLDGSVWARDRCSSSGTAAAPATRTAPAGSAWPRVGRESSGAPSAFRASARR